MTEEEKLNSEIRELKMRLRETRSENADLKLTQMRWFRLCAGISLVCCMFCITLVIWDSFSDPTTAMPLNSTSEVYGTSGLLSAEENSVTQVLEPKTPPVKKEETIDDFIMVPSLLPENHLETVKEKIEELTESTSFSLPGHSNVKKSKTIYYTVRKNDTLWKIANRYYKSFKAVNKIKKDNGLVNSEITPGMELVLVLD